MSCLLNSVTWGSTKSVITPTTSSDPALTHAVTRSKGDRQISAVASVNVDSVSVV